MKLSVINRVLKCMLNGSWLMAQGPWLMAQRSWLLAQGSLKARGQELIWRERCRAWGAHIQFVLAMSHEP